MLFLEDFLHNAASIEKIALLAENCANAYKFFRLKKIQHDILPKFGLVSLDDYFAKQKDSKLNYQTDDNIRLALFYYNNGNFSEALKLFNKSINSGNSLVYEKLADIYIDNNDYENAIKVIEIWKNNDEGNYKPYNRLGWIYRKFGRFNESEKM